LSKPLHVKIGKLESPPLAAENIDLVIGSVVIEEEWEPTGPASRPSLPMLRAWDLFLLKRYEPMYVVENKLQHAKTLLTLTVSGALAYLALAKRRLRAAYRRLGEDAPIELGVAVEAPLTRLLIGIRPKVLTELEEPLRYAEEQIVEISAAIHSNQEASIEDLESKMFHIGTATLLLTEVAEIANLMLVPKGIKVPEKLEFGKALIDFTKPVVLILGDVPEVVDVVEYCERSGYIDKIEIVTGGCYALDTVRVGKYLVKVVGTLDDVRDVVGRGLVDVLIVGEQGAIPDIVEKAKEKGTVVITTTERAYLGLPDLTGVDTEKIVEAVKSGTVRGFAVLDAQKLAEVVPRVALVVYEARKEVKPKALEEVKEVFSREKYVMKPPLGPVPEPVIRDLGVPVVMGTIPGIIAVVGCSNYGPSSLEELGEILEELCKRNFLILTTGCTAIALSKYRTKEAGHGLYEDFPDQTLVMGSPTAIAHIAGLALKVPQIFARMPLRSNAPALVDYLLNRVGAVGLAWSAPLERDAAIAWGVLRCGVPVVAGPALAPVGRLFLGDPTKPEKYVIYDKRTKKKVFVGPVPEHLLCLAKNKDEALILITKLVMRANDGHSARAIKACHYVDMYRKVHGTLPPDLPNYIRAEADIAITVKDEVMKFLQEKGWKPLEEPLVDPTCLPLLQEITSL